jgi:hypothetical protein
VIGVFITVVTVVYAAGKVNERIDTLVSWKSGVDKKFEHYDEVGTKALSSFMNIEELRQVEQDRRIQTVERQMDTMVPDVRELKTKIEMVANLLQEQRNSTPHQTQK